MPQSLISPKLVEKVEKSQPPVPAKSVPCPVDLADVLSVIDVQLARLKWDKEKVAAFLKEVYGQTSRAMLRDEELMDFKERILAL
ncbi:MAG: hypothetical protein HC810_02665 [Acaryochloridaceae cyanobacterium RL_2_7]|nr:hypothetical protein [Acaryochloridaceae cyanobacterium RL_2_7]